MADQDRAGKIRTVFEAAAQKARRENPRLRLELTPLASGASVAVSSSNRSKSVGITFNVKGDGSIITGNGPGMMVPIGKLFDDNAEGAILAAIRSAVADNFG